MRRLQTTLLLIAVCLPIVILLASPTISFAQNRQCDPSLKSVKDDPFGYRPRGDRCEGRYILEVANDVLCVASLTESFEKYDVTSGEDLHIEWTIPHFKTKNLQIQAEGLKDGLSYRMDTTPDLKDAPYRWPVSVLKALNISSDRVGVVGWTWHKIGPKDRKLYLPLSIRQESPPYRSPNYLLTLWPGRELSEIYVTLAPVDKKGKLGPFLKDEEPLGFNFYPAMRRIDIPLNKLQAPGIYYLNIAATQDEGGAVEVELYFYHSG